MKATFAAGCFWGVQAEFDNIAGVKNTTAGYTGGKTKNPAYEDVCSGATGHAESVEVEYDPEIVTYGELLDVFWEIHNPTTLNKQGLDIGTQYRSAIFWHNEKQKKEALESREKQQKSHESRIVTEIKKAGKFYKAEEYHQKYLKKHGKAVC